MARFYGSVDGSRARSTAIGSEKSGITGHLRGWKTGAIVDVSSVAKDVDFIRVYRTGGSYDARRLELVASWCSYVGNHNGRKENDYCAECRQRFICYTSRNEPKTKDG